MIKILYVPSGECLQFIADNATSRSTREKFTPNYENSHWRKVWDNTPMEVIEQFCQADAETESKERHRIPTGVELNPNEFEILYE